MKILVLVVQDATQAKLILNPQLTVIKIPGFLPIEKQIEVRNKLIKIADINEGNKQFLKLYYKIGTPYLFLNRKIDSNKKETAAVYKYDEL
jgi:hypothetical protein